MIRVLIVDDHTIVRRGLKAFLAQTEDIQIIAEADNGLEIGTQHLLTPSTFPPMTI
jgi:YesN/AraC family two-component response regulator